MSRTGINSYGSHVPFWRLSGTTVADALGGRASNGCRAVASYDEDTTTMAVEAARGALGSGTGSGLDALVFSTGSPVYADRTNATGIHAALQLEASVRATDTTGSTRSAVTSLLAALHSNESTLVAMSDVAASPAGAANEVANGDAGAAFAVGPETDATLARMIGSGSVTQEFLDRWRAPGDMWSQTWEERFPEGIYTDLGMQALDAALKSASVAIGDIDRIAVTGTSPRAARAVIKQSGIATDRVAPDLIDQIGYTGAAHPGVLLANMLEEADPDQVLVLVSLVDGADALVLRTTDAVTHARPSRSVASQVAAGTDTLTYADYLSWKGLVTRSTARRPDPDRAAAPPSYRAVAWKFGFVGTECRQCHTRHLPPQRVCLRCGTTDDMAPVRLADAKATVATYTIDRLAYSPAPPVVGAVIDFDGGGRFSCELTDVDPEAVRIGHRVEMTFRCLSTTGGVHNYFWKARPINEGAVG